MYIHHHVIQNYETRYRWDDYTTVPKKCITTIANKVIQCAPLLTAFIAIGALFSLINQIEARYIFNQPIESTTTTFVPDNVMIVYIGPPHRSVNCRLLDFCLWGSGRKNNHM